MAGLVPNATEYIIIITERYRIYYNYYYNHHPVSSKIPVQYLQIIYS